MSAIILLMVIMGFGLGLLLLTDNQQKASAREQAKESAFNVAEAALNAQVGQISRAWPGAKPLSIPNEEGSPCTPVTTTATNGCPTKESLEVGYKAAVSPVRCSATSEPWGSSISNQWTTYVRDDSGPAESSYFESAQVMGKEAWDANKDGKVWVRAVGVSQCQVVSVVTLVAQQFVSADFPKDVLSANWFETSNNGKGHEEIIDTKGKASQPGEVSVRCKGFTGTEAEILKECAKYREGQINPEKIEGPPGTPSPTLSATQLEELKHQAEWAGTYYAPGKCPSGIPAGKDVYVEGPCALSQTGNVTINSEASPGFLVIVNGTFSLGGNANFYGTVYDVNQQGSSGVVVTVGGNAQVIGALDVDGNGGIAVGESHKKNLIFDPKSAEKLTTYVGATPTRNTFRVLPSNQ